MRADETMRPLGQGGEAPSSLETRAADFLADARPTRGLTDAEMGAIERRLQRPSRARRRLWLSPVLVAGVVLLVAGSVMAVIGGWRPHLPRIGATSKRPAPVLSRPEGARASAPVAVPADEPAERPAPSAATVVPSYPSGGRRTARPAPALQPPAAAPDWPALAASNQPVSESALSVEARWLADALSLWRRDHNAEAALASLADHDRRFPHGSLSVESKVAHAEILLALSRRPQALGVLDALVLQNLPRARELETIRGELRAEAGRCLEARANLAHVLRGTSADELGQRARHALAKCP